MEELRLIFLSGAAYRNGARQFRDQRVAMIREGTVPLALRGEGRLILHIVPVSSLADDLMIDMHRLPSEAYFPPLGVSGFNHCYNADGFLSFANPEQEYLQVFHSGRIESVAAGIARKVDQEWQISAPGIARSILEAVDTYFPNMAKLGISPPFIIMVTLEGIRGARVVCDLHWRPQSTTIAGYEFCLPELVFESHGTAADHRQWLKPMFDVLWNAGGYANCNLYDENGIWRGEQ